MCTIKEITSLHHFILPIIMHIKQEAQSVMSCGGDQDQKGK